MNDVMTDSSSFVSELERSVAEIETKSSAEIVFAFADHSGDYSYADLWWGIFCALITLAVLVWSHWVFHPDLILLNVLVSFVLGWFLSRKWPAMRRVMTTTSRRAVQVREASEIQFLALGVDQTKARTGILVYVSRFERALVVRPDRLVQALIPAETFEAWQRRFGTAKDVERLLNDLPSLLAALKLPLALHLPRGIDDINELPDRPMELSS